MTAKEKTVGEIALDLQKKGDLQTDSIELQREIHKGSSSKKSYEEEVWECVERGKKDPKIEGDFFVVVLFKKERHLQNIIRQYFLYRQTCPTPEYDQTVYQYHRKQEQLQYIWTIPNNATCQYLPLMDEVPFDQELLLSMVEAFKSGQLEHLANVLNGIVCP